MNNKYKTASRIFIFLFMILAASMLIYTFIDYGIYIKHPEYSAPYSLHLIIIGASFGIPGAGCLMLSYVLKRKSISREI